MPHPYTVSARFTAVDRMSAKMAVMSKNMSRFALKTQAAFARIEMAARKVTRGIGRLLKRFGTLGVVLGGAVIIGIMSSMIGTFATFEQANASLSSVMSDATIPQLKALQVDAKRLGATTAKSATQVVGLQEAFARLGFQAPQIINMTEATIAGSIAMKGELADTAELVGAVVKTFDKFSSIDAPNIIDQMTLATQKSALNFEKLQTSLPIVAGAANAAGVPFTRLLSLLGKLSDSGIDASSSANALKRIFIESAKQGLSYEQILNKIVKESDKLTASVDEFGVRASVSSVILSKNIRQTESLDKALKNAGGTAEIAAKKQLDTLTGSVTILKSAWEGFVLSIEDGNGKIGVFLKNTIKVATEILSLASGAAKAKEELSEKELVIRKAAKRVMFFIKTLKWLVIVFGAIKAAILINKAVLLVYKGVLFGSAAIVKAVTIAQWAWNAALLANPIGLIIIAIVALIVIITLVIKKWNKWGAALSLFLGPLGMVISIIQSFRRNWDMVKQAFKTGGILGGLKAIGRVLIDALLMPVQQLLKLLSKIPGIGSKIAPGVDKIQALRERLGVNTTTDESGDPLELNTSKTSIANESFKREERIEKQKAEIFIKKEKGVDVDVDFPSGFPIKLEQTL